MLARLAVLGVMRLPRSSKSRPTSRAPEAARRARVPLRLEVSFSWTASNTVRVMIGACSPGWLASPGVELAEVAPVAQHVRERAVGERYAPDGPARAQPAPSRDDAALPQLALQRRERSELKVALEDQPHRRGLILPDHELALPHLVSERDDAADPDAPALR